jgi:hypothetical protein
MIAGRPDGEVARVTAWLVSTAQSKLPSLVCQSSDVRGFIALFYASAVVRCSRHCAYILEIYPGRDTNMCRQAPVSAECKSEEAAVYLADNPVLEEAGAEQCTAGDGLLELWQQFRTEL